MYRPLNYRYTFKARDFIKFYTHFLDRISTLLIIVLLAYSNLYIFFKITIAGK